MSAIKTSLLIAVCCLWAQPAQGASCSNGREMIPMTAVLDPGLGDPPGQVEILAADIRRGPDTTGMKCISEGAVGFQVVAPEDDHTAPQDLGYLVELVGDGEAVVWLADGVVEADEVGDLYKWLGELLRKRPSG